MWKKRPTKTTNSGHLQSVKWSEVRPFSEQRPVASAPGDTNSLLQPLVSNASLPLTAAGTGTGLTASDQRWSIATSTTLSEPACRRCRNHSFLVPWKGHKRFCPFKYEKRAFFTDIISILLAFKFDTCYLLRFMIYLQFNRRLIQGWFWLDSIWTYSKKIYNAIFSSSFSDQSAGAKHCWAVHKLIRNENKIDIKNLHKRYVTFIFNTWIYYLCLFTHQLIQFAYNFSLGLLKNE